MSSKINIPKIGMKVIDSDGKKGEIFSIDLPHNILVLFDNKGEGYYCLDEKCEYYDPLYISESNE